MINVSKQPTRASLAGKPRRLRYAEVQAAKEQTTARDLKRVLGGLATPEEVRKENQALTDDELQTFQLMNLEQILKGTR